MPGTVNHPEHVGIRRTTSTMSMGNRWHHALARFGVNRGGHRVEPGLYALGQPTPDSPVFVTANYMLSFDAVRSALVGIDGYILVLDTKGVNVWCAAGKGTFGTDELVHRIESTQLSNVVRRRLIILPQLAAAGVAAHEVKKRSGFSVEYGPVRATDLPQYLKNRQATAQMRTVRFGLAERSSLVPVEVVSVLVLLLLATAAWFLFGRLVALEAIVALLAATVAFPLLLPWLPTHDFSTKGFILGVAVILPFAALRLFSHPEVALWQRVVASAATLLIWPSVTAFLTLNFTGATTFTSRSGVRREIFRYIPVMAVMFASGILLSVVKAIGLLEGA
jgi:hypothetical protein